MWLHHPIDSISSSATTQVWLHQPTDCVPSSVITPIRQNHLAGHSRATIPPDRQYHTNIYITQPGISPAITELNYPVQLQPHLQWYVHTLVCTLLSYPLYIRRTSDEILLQIRAELSRISNLITYRRTQEHSDSPLLVPEFPAFHRCIYA